MMMMKIYVYLKVAKTSMYVGSMVSKHNKNQYENLVFYLLYSSELVSV